MQLCRKLIHSSKFCMVENVNTAVQPKVKILKVHTKLKAKIYSNGQA